MSGVEILAMEEVVASYEFSWIIYFGVLIVVSITMCATFCFNEKYPTAQDALAGLIVGIVFGALIGLLPAAHCFPDEYETHYKVTISDEVSMNDFLERYEILSQEGKIYTVRERNGDNND